MRKNDMILSSILFCILASAACGLRQAGQLPPEESLYLPSPDDAANAANRLLQPVCASDTEAYDRLLTWIDEHNDAIQSQIALIKLMVRASSRSLDREGEFEYEVEKEGRTLLLHAVVAEDDAVNYTATFSGPSIDSYEFLTGTTAADRQSGTWHFNKPDGTEVVEVTWTREGDDLTVVRKRLDRDREATYTRTGTDATIAFVGAQHTATASWDTETLDGSFSIDGENAVCWEKTGEDFCSLTCP